MNTSPNPGTNNVLDGVAAITKDDTWAVGYTDNQTLTEHWNGSAWSVVLSANQSAQDQLVAVAAISSNNVWAVGSNGDPNNISQAMAERWNGTSWNLSPVVAPGVSSQFTSVTRIPDSSNVWAAGHSTDTNHVDHTLIERWSGSVWKVVSSPNVKGNGVLWSAAQVGSTGNVWAAGTYFDAHSGLNQTLIAYWNGHSWNTVPSPNVAGTNNIFFGVSSTSSTNAWAVGLTFNNNSSINHALTVFWNGTSWKIVSSPDAQGNSELNAVTHAPESHFYFSVGNSGNNGSYSTVTERHC